ncbi:MAG: YihY/virulence factor BrkB family protein [Chloroflexota bacterium]|nr:YihY/virulence factor BrkB family protein [Chloroflexota bacterium]
MTNLLDKAVRRIDGFQQKRPPFAFIFAVVKKFGDDQAGNLAALVAYYGFFSLFPLLMVAVTVLGMFTARNPSLRTTIVNSALRNFPIIGPQISRNVHALNGSGLTLAIAIVLTLWSGLGVIKVFETAMNTVWDVPYRERPNFLWATLRAVVMLAVLGAMTSLSTLVVGVGAGSDSWWLTSVGILVSLALNVLLFLFAFRILTAADISWSDAAPGAVVGAVAWTTLEAVGGYYVGHQLRSASEVYGTFAIVIGLLAWIYLGAQVTLYAAEINVVRKDHLWPRSLFKLPPHASGPAGPLRSGRSGK